MISEIFFCMWTFVFSYFNLSLSSRIRFFSWMSSAFSLVCLYCIDVSFSVSFPCLFVLIHVSVQIVFWTVKKKSPMIDVWTFMHDILKWRLIPMCWSDKALEKISTVWHYENMRYFYSKRKIRKHIHVTYDLFKTFFLKMSTIKIISFTIGYFDKFLKIFVVNIFILPI